MLVSGSSAGGLSTLLHIDYIADALPAAHVRAVPEVGFFIDGASIWAGAHIMTAAYTRAQTFSNISAGAPEQVNAACVAATPPALRFRCFMAQYTYPFIKTPTFLLNSAVDEWQLSNILAIDPNITVEEHTYAPWAPCIAAPAKACNATQYQQFEGYAEQFHAALAAARAAQPPAARAASGGFITSCDLHTTAIGGLSHRIKIGGVSMYEALSEWWAAPAGTLNASAAWRFDGPWPSNPTCAGPLADKWRGFEL